MSIRIKVSVTNTQELYEVFKLLQPITEKIRGARQNPGSPFITAYITAELCQNPTGSPAGGKPCNSPLDMV